MFYHAYRAYMDNAFPADELQPLSCKGRIRGVSPSRGDMDDVMGKLVSVLMFTTSAIVRIEFVNERNSVANKIHFLSNQN